MNTLSLSQFLTLYTWFPLAGLLLFMLVIARFYEKFSGRKTFFRFFLLPIVLFGAWSVRASGNLPDDALASLIATVAGVSTIILSIRLGSLMLYQLHDGEEVTNDY